MKFNRSVPPGTVDNMVEMKSKVDFYSQWVNDVVEHCSQLNEDLPDDLSKVPDCCYIVKFFCVGPVS